MGQCSLPSSHCIKDVFLSPKSIVQSVDNGKLELEERRLHGKSSSIVIYFTTLKKVADNFVFNLGI